MILWQWKVSLNSLNLNLTSLSDKRKIFFPVVTICNNLELRPNETIWTATFVPLKSATIPTFKRDFSEFWTLRRVVCECLYVSNALIICNSLFVECAIVIFDGFNFKTDSWHFKLKWQDRKTIWKIKTTEKIIMKTLDIKEYVLNSIFSQK